MNKSEVENIQSKYSHLHNQGTTTLKEEHNREVKIVLGDLDRQQWLVKEKNTEIQTLLREKRDQRKYFDDQELALNSQVATLKNQLYAT